MKKNQQTRNLERVHSNEVKNASIHQYGHKNHHGEDQQQSFTINPFHHIFHCWTVIHRCQYGNRDEGGKNCCESTMNYLESGS